MTIDEPTLPLWRHPLLVAVAAGTVLVFTTGIATGVIAGTIDRGSMKPIAAASLVAAVIVAGACAWLLRRVLPLAFTKTSPRVERARRLTIWSGFIGGLVGVLLVLGSLSSGQGPPDVFTNDPMPGWLAAAAIAILLLLVPPVTWAWHRSIDEHEANAYRDGTLAGIYAYCAIAPTWWLGWRGGFLPEPQEMITFLIVMAVWGIVWAWRRYA